MGFWEEIRVYGHICIQRIQQELRLHCQKREEMVRFAVLEVDRQDFIKITLLLLGIMLKNNHLTKGQVE